MNHYVSESAQLDKEIKQNFDFVDLDALGICKKRSSLDKSVDNYGNRLLLLCKDLNLLIANGRLFKDKNIGALTCKESTVVDYCIMSPELFTNILDFEILPYDPMLSDVHNAIYIEMSSKDTCMPVVENINVDIDDSSVVTKSVIHSIVVKLEEIDTDLIDNIVVNSIVDECNSLILQAASKCDLLLEKKVIRKVDNSLKKRKVKKPWFNRECAEKRKLYHRAKNYNWRVKTAESKTNLTVCSKEYKKVLCNQYRLYNKNFIKKLKNLRQNDCKSYWNLLNRACSSQTKQNIVNKVSLDCFYNHFKKLNSAQDENDDTFENIDVDNITSLNTEVNRAISENEQGFYLIPDKYCWVKNQIQNMRVKEIDKTANLDATFSTTAALEIYHLDLSDSSLHMPLVASIPSEHRFHKVVWGSHGMSDGSSGVIVAGADNGNLFCYDGASMIKGSDKLLFKQDKHVGAVKALDFNNFQSNLLASGASESEIFIWDLNKSESPMTPGAKSQVIVLHTTEEVSCVCWNKQVQHILASTFGSRCVVWDLRKNEPIIKVSDSMSRIKCSKVAWHPDVPTQMCLSSEDDHTPVIQMWDLRYATSPVKTFENHQRGVLDIAWCPQDSDLLLSCGKDNRILCWNPNSDVPGGEVIYELPTSTQWCFDVQWCPRNPGVISSSSFDGHVSMYSLMGGGHPIHIADKVADSFQSNDPFAQAAAAHQVQQTQNVMPLQKPPKWLRKPVGASFGFGGKLVSFDSSSSTTQQPSPKNVYVSQVVTETELLNSSSQLEQALVNGQYVEFCAMKSANSSDEIQENIWNFLRVNFEKEPREHYIELLGYDKTELARKVIIFTVFK
ncbi:SEC31 [Mytilus edulis]|uniref:SEC31 n=1 Tax=Mytilus edulis TaxID=6550 RepID=A0A8S3VGH0_MYTED|nr:SEC31 [Mytilus edulis]